MPLVFKEPKAHFPIVRRQHEDDVVLRIRRMLDLALHKETPKHEAEHAMRNAQRMMTKHNLNATRVMLETSADDAETIETNMFHIYMRTPTNTKPQFWRWTIDASAAIAQSFGCKTCNNGTDIRVSFYGLQSAAEAASAIFIKFCSYIDERMSSYTPPDEDRYDGLARATYTRRERIAFCNGMVAGLVQALADERAVETNKKKRLREYVDLRDRLQREPGDEMLDQILRELARELGIGDGDDDASRQLIVIEQTVARIDSAGDQVLDRMNMKLGKGKPRVISGRRTSAYEQGVREGKRMKTKTIE